MAPKTVSLFVDLEVITLNAEGEWLSNGQPIEHETTLELFPKLLKRDEQGYFLQLQHETKRIVVEDTPFFVRALEGDRERGYMMILNDGTREPLDPSTLAYRPGRLVASVKGGELAKFKRAPYFELLKDIQEDQKGYFLILQGDRFDLSLSS
jgi:hypothetical protein